MAGTQISSVEGSVEREALAGTYDVRPDCTDAETFTFYPSGETVHADFVVVAQGKQILFVDTDSGVVLSVTATRQ